MIALFLASLASASAVITYTDLNITVKDITTNEMIPSSPIDLKFTEFNKGTTINLTDFINEQGMFLYRLNLGNWKLAMKIDNPLTPETDYYAERTFLIEENNPSEKETVYLVSVGAVEGNVINPSGKLISNADVTFKCKSYKSSSKTDNYGSFRQDLLPVGQCMVQAAFDDLAGSSEFNVTQGQVSETTVYLNKDIFTTTKRYMYVIMGVIAGIVLVLLVYLAKRRGMLRSLSMLWKDNKKEVKKLKRNKTAKAERNSKATMASKDKTNKTKEDKQEQKETKEEDPAQGLSEQNPRARDIIKTLNEKEKRVVDFIITQEGYKSTQASIRNDTGIPKTSLVRVFASLEAKKVVKIESIGKLKKIELTSWFLGKE
ncbi:MAG: hypothetical protein NT001_04195 [Candidatus Woesearchaeota archaeon]|nr:hypothetical protein [Candidatus Woesearchaeota archaeon]